MGGASLNILLAEEEAASEVRLGGAREPRDAGKENPFTGLGYPVHPDCGAAHPFDFKTETTRVKYWLAAKCSSTIFFKKAAVRSAGIELTKRGIHSRDH